MKLMLAGVLALATFLTLSSTAIAVEIPDGNLTQNPSFELDKTGWQPTQASLRRVAAVGAPQGSFAGRVQRQSGSSYWVADKPATVPSTTAGDKYAAKAWVRAAASAAVGNPVALEVNELAPNGSVVARTRVGTELSNAFQELSLTAAVARNGDKLQIKVIQEGAGAGDVFDFDAISLVRFVPPPPPPACPDGRFHVEYFANMNLEGEPAATDCVDKVDEDWGGGGPAGLPVDGFSARYEGRIEFSDEADYEFVGGGDDGFRVFIDGEPIFDEWFDHSFKQDTVIKPMTRGWHDVKVEFYEDSVDARVLFKATSLDPGDPTLFPVDGGPGYYGRFSNPLPTDSSFFPIAVWLQCVNSQQDIDLDKEVGINTYIGVCHEGPWSLELPRQNGMNVIPQQNEWVGDPAVGSESKGWILWDEADMLEGAPRTGFERLDGILASLPQDGRLRYENYGKGVAFWLNDADAARFVNNYADVLSADVYWFTEPSDCGETELSKPGVIGVNGCRVGANYGWLVNRERSLMDPPRSKPVWAFVEVGHPFTEDDAPTITAPQIRSAVWHSLIAGARGVEYFNHSFGGSCESSSVLRDLCGAAVREPVKELNEQITALAPVLNAPSVEGGWTEGDNTRTMVKLYGGHLYLFMGAAGVGGTGTFNLECIGNATATVIDEGRSVPVVDGVLTDSFADANAVHIYRIDGGSTCGLA